jgi:hypothetical protein
MKLKIKIKRGKNFKNCQRNAKFVAKFADFDIIMFNVVKVCLFWRKLSGNIKFSGCKQFFRRIVIKQKEFHCLKFWTCDFAKGTSKNGPIIEIN